MDPRLRRSDPRPHGGGGLLNGYWDPTRLYYAAQTWQTAVNGPSSPVSIEWDEETTELGWKDDEGRSYRIWWRGNADSGLELANTGAAEGDWQLVDPYYARLISRYSAGTRPVAGWPIVARREN